MLKVVFEMFLVVRDLEMANQQTNEGIFKENGC